MHVIVIKTRQDRNWRVEITTDDGHVITLRCPDAFVSAELYGHLDKVESVEVKKLENVEQA